jgi:hypothetical protein
LCLAGHLAGRTLTAVQLLFLGSPVTFDYAPPFAFNGEIEKVVIEVK